MANCKIITTAYNPNKQIITSQAWPWHPQDLHTPELYREMIQRLFRIESETDPGVPVDTYVVVYEDKYGGWKDWLPYDGRPIKRGTFHVITEKRDGGNYQLFNTAYQQIKDQYDWFIFTCDDILVFGPTYYQRILARWEPGCGYVALQGGGETNEPQNHVQGSIGMTSKKIILEVCGINGGELPHSKQEPWTQEANIKEGEIPFTKRILDLGYYFLNYNNSQKWDLENLCYPYYMYAHESH